MSARISDTQSALNLLGTRDSNPTPLVSKTSALPAELDPTEPPAGVEPATRGLQGRRSGRLSYRGMLAGLQRAVVAHVPPAGARPPRREPIVSEAGLEPARPLRGTRISAWHVCLFPSPGPGAVTRCRPGPAALRGQRHKPCATAELRHLDSNQDQQVQGLPGCQLPHTASLPAVFSPAGVTALFLPREGPDTDSQDGRVIRSWAGRGSNPRCTAFGAAGSSAGLPARAISDVALLPSPAPGNYRTSRSATDLVRRERFELPSI
jgi:hypothetical protein